MSKASQDWQPIATAPKDGTRVRVAHELDPSSTRVDSICPTTGAFEGGEWVCSSGFVCVDGMFRFQPTHWLKSEAEGRRDV